MTTNARLHEQTANTAIGDWLDKRADWDCQPEPVDAIQGSSARPDILIRHGDRMPVIVEMEFGLPALTDAKSRLGKNLNSDPRKFTEVIALGLDEQFRNKRAGDITSALNANEQIFTVQFVSTPPPPDRMC